MVRALRGEIYRIDPDPVRGREQGGYRPVVILSHDIFNERSGTVIGMLITGQPQRVGYPLTWRLPEGILPRESWVKIGQVRTFAVERLGSRIARLDDRDLQTIVEGLRQLIE